MSHNECTHHQVACAQEQDHTKDVNHACGEDTIPGTKEHRLPHKQLDPPPRLARLPEPLNTETHLLKDR